MKFNVTILNNKSIFESEKFLYKYIGKRGFTNMRNFTKKLSAITLCTLFASMQIASAAIDTGLNNAVINKTEGGYVGMDVSKDSATLKFDGNTHVNWDTLNVGKGENLNFNAVNGANGLTILNTVNKGMTNVYGTISSNEGISKLIISNPNGMLYDGATFTTAGDLMLTTQALGATFTNGNIDIKGINEAAINGITIQNSDFSVGGEFNITAPSVDIIKTAITANKGLRLVTADGQNYLVCTDPNNDEKHTAVRLESVSVDGNVYIVSAKDIVKVVNGGKINGNLKIESDGNVGLNYVDGGKVFEVTGNVDVANDGRTAYLKNSKVGGNLNMSNSGGFLEVADSHVAGDANLKTTVKSNEGVKHFIHVVGDTTVDGNLNIDSIHNIHIGGYNSDMATLAPGSLKVGKDLNATAREGSVAITIDTSADKVALTSGTLNVITDGKAVIKANDYKFDAKHYIGGISDTDYLINTVMEKYTPIKGIVGEKAFVTVDGGNVTKIKTDKTGYAFVRSNNDMNVNGVDAGKVNLSSAKDIVIGKDAKADVILVDGETRNLTVETPSRDYTLKYTNIKDTAVITVNPETEITYDMANGPQGWNKGTQTSENTYLVVPGEPAVPPVTPPAPTPNPDPKKPQDNDNVKILNNLQRDQVASAIDANQVYTPVAFAADLDEEIETGVRKNVDGSVTVVRPFTPKN